MGKDSFILHDDYAEQIEFLTDKQAGVLLKAIYAYRHGKMLPKMDSAVNMAFSFIRSQLNREQDRYTETCEKRRLAGIQGAAARWNSMANDSKSKQAITKMADNDYDYDNDYDNSKKERKDIYINNNQSACACDEEQQSHEDIMREYGLDVTVCESLKDFLRHCYLNKHIVSNAKLSDIIFRLIERYGNDNKGMVESIEIAIRGGYFDVKA